MRVTTAFNKMLSIPSATVASVEFTPEGVVVGLRRRKGRPVCPCRQKASGAYDSSVRRWRGLDLGASKLLLEAEIRRLHCRRCDRVRTEAVPWARPRARHSRDFEDVVAWLAQRTDKTTITRLLRTSWETVAGIVERVVAEQIDTRRLSGLLRIGIDEISLPRAPLPISYVESNGGWIITDRHHDHELRGAVAHEHRGEVAGPGPARASRRVAHDLDQPGPCASHHRRLCARAGGVPAGL